jgi:hypothetical protein
MRISSNKSRTNRRWTFAQILGFWTDFDRLQIFWHVFCHTNYFVRFRLFSTIRCLAVVTHGCRRLLQLVTSDFHFACVALNYCRALTRWHTHSETCWLKKLLRNKTFGSDRIQNYICVLQNTQVCGTRFWTVWRATFQHKMVKFHWFCKCWQLLVRVTQWMFSAVGVCALG